MTDHRKYKDLLKQLNKLGKLEEFVKSYTKNAGRNSVSESKVNEAFQDAVDSNEEAHFLEAMERVVRKPLETHLKMYTAPIKARRNKKLLWVTGIAILLGCLFTGAYYVLDSKGQWPGKDYEYYYVLPNTLKLRDLDADRTVLDTLEYGQKVKLKEENELNDYVTVSSRPESLFKSKTGQVNSFYLVSESDLILYHSILDRGELDNLSLNESWMRKALIEYYKAKHYIGGNTLTDENLMKIVDTTDSPERWSFKGVLTHGSDIRGIIIDERLSTWGKYVSRRYKSAARFGEMLNTRTSMEIERFTAVILRNVDSGLQRLLFFEFDEDQYAKVIGEFDLPDVEDDFVLKVVPKGFKDFRPFRSYVKDHEAIVCRSKNTVEAEVHLFHWNQALAEFEKTIHRIPAK